jgi:hypothetical protein
MNCQRMMCVMQFVQMIEVITLCAIESDCSYVSSSLLQYQRRLMQNGTTNTSHGHYRVEPTMLITSKRNNAMLNVIQTY